MSDVVDTEYTADLARILYQHALNQEFTDFRIRAGSKTVYCHQAIISAKSEYFHSICASGLTEAILEHAKEEDGQILTSVLKFLYLGKTNITVQNVESLVLAASFIKHSELKQQCEKVMIANLTMPNLSRYHELARKVDLMTLSDECARMGREMFPEVSHTDWFLSLSIDELEQYLQDDDLNVPTEDHVIDALQRWLRHSRATSSGKEGYIDVLFHCIRLPYCSQSKLEAISKDSNVVDKFRLKILEYLQHGLYGDRAARKSYSASYESKPTGSSGTPGTSGASAKSTTPTPTPSGKARARLSGYTDKSAGFPAPPRASTTDTAGQEKVLILGGQKNDNSPLTDIIALGDENTPDTTITSMSSVDFSVCATGDSFIVSGGKRVEYQGNAIPHVRQFRLSTMVWTDLADMPKPVSNHRSACVDNRVFTIGGTLMEYYDEKYISSVNSLDITSNTWSPCEDIPEAIEEPGIAVIEKDILSISGWNGDSHSRQTYKFNTRSLKWTMCCPMPDSYGLVGSSTVAINKMVFALYRYGFLQYDVAVDQWSELPLPLKPSHKCALVLKQGRLMMLGGFESTATESNDRIQTYDVTTKTWKLEKKRMPVALWDHQAIVLPARKA